MDQKGIRMIHRAIASGLLAFSMLGSKMVHAEPRLDPRGDATINYLSRYSTIALSTSKTRFAPGEEIVLQFEIKNRGARAIRFYPGTEGIESYDFLILDHSGREIDPLPLPQKIQSREWGERSVVTVEGEMVKEIILAPGEYFTKEIVLSDYYNLQPGETYNITGYFHPDARSEFFVKSHNSVKLAIDRLAEEGYNRQKQPDPLYDQGDGLTPEETVYLFLSAEMKKNWKNYLKYLDLSKYITVYDRFSSRYVRASDREKSVVMNDFVRYLTGRDTEKLQRFKIVEAKTERDDHGEIIDGGRSQVKARAIRESRGFRVEYEYTYTLEPDEQQHGFWRISHVTAMVVD